MLLSCFSFSDDSSQTSLLRLSPSGELLNSRRIWPSLKRIGLFDAAAVLGGQAIDLMGVAEDSMNSWSIIRYRVDFAGNAIDSLLLTLPSTSWISFDNVLRLSSGKLVVPAARTGAGEPPFSRMTLALLEDDGSFYASMDYLNPFNMMLSRGIAEIAPDTFMLATDAGFTELNQWGDWGAFTEFSTSLTPISGFGQVIVSGAPDPLFSNSIWSAHTVHSLPSGDLILSGRYASHGAVARTNRQGQLQSVFLPEPAPYSNYPAVLGGVTLLASNKILFTFHENFGQNFNDLWAPFQPNVVKVYLLDTLLNEECALTLDGSIENAFHWVNRTLETSDGGFILIGGKMDFDEQPPRWRYWAQKYPSGACFTAVDEHAAPNQVRVFPNPGSHEVNFSLNGPERAAYAELLDVQGRVVGQARFHFWQARITTHDEPAGIYAYRVIADDGSLISAGRWVKE